MSDRNKKRGGANKGVSEVELIGTADSKLFHRNQPGQGDIGEEGFAQPKGVQTRAAIANHLAKKLKIANSSHDLTTLMSIEKEIHSSEKSKDSFWEDKLREERKRLEETRLQQEQELQQVIAEAKMDFPNTEPTVVMMTHDLQEKLKQERAQSGI